MRLALLVGFKVGLALIPLGALYTVPLAQAWEVLGGFSICVLLEMPLIGEISLNLVDIAGIAARLLLRV